jgi:hypothetical protein
MAIKDKNKMHNLQDELIYLQQPEVAFTGSLVPLSAVVRFGSINSKSSTLSSSHYGDAINSRRQMHYYSKNGVIYSSSWRCY